MTNTAISDELQTQILVIYVVQMLGCPTVHHVYDVILNKIQFKTTLLKISNALNSAKKRGILSLNNIPDNDGSSVRAYSMKDVRFSNPPELAHLKVILPRLLEDDGGRKIYALMEGEHLKGEHKGGRLPDIRDYVHWSVTMQNIVPILGGQPFSSDSTEKDLAKGICKHRRVNGEIWFPMNLWIRGAIKTKLRQFNITESKELYISASDIFFTPKQPVIEIDLPSPPARPGQQGTGIVKFEAIQPGQQITFNLSFPTTNGIPPDIMKTILANGIRIGARNREYGLLKLIKIDN